MDIVTQQQISGASGEVQLTCALARLASTLPTVNNLWRAKCVWGHHHRTPNSSSNLSEPKRPLTRPRYQCPLIDSRPTNSIALSSWQRAHGGEYSYKSNMALSKRCGRDLCSPTYVLPIFVRHIVTFSTNIPSESVLSA